MLKYCGDGFLPGVPARDLNNNDVKKFGNERLLMSGIYFEVYRKPKQVVAEPTLLDKEHDYDLRS